MEYFKNRDEKFVPAILAGDPEKARKVVVSVLEPLFAEHKQAIDEVIRLVNERNAEIETSAALVIRDRMRLVLAIGCGLIVAVISAAAWIVRGITGPLRRTVQTLRDVAKGDLTKRVAVRANDEFGQMADSLNQALEGLHRAFQMIAKSTKALYSLIGANVVN